MQISEQERNDALTYCVNDMVDNASATTDLYHLMKHVCRELMQAVLEGKTSLNLNLEDCKQADLKEARSEARKLYREWSSDFFSDQLTDAVNELYK
ncbi:hypothetical protein [Parasutterella excrementihominis]